MHKNDYFSIFFEKDIKTLENQQISVNKKKVVVND